MQDRPAPEGSRGSTSLPFSQLGRQEPQSAAPEGPTESISTAHDAVSGLTDTGELYLHSTAAGYGMLCVVPPHSPELRLLAGDAHHVVDGLPSELRLAIGDEEPGQFVL